MRFISSIVLAAVFVFCSPGIYAAGHSDGFLRVEGKMAPDASGKALLLKGFPEGTDKKRVQETLNPDEQQ
jgi:hypothetical protein